MLFAIIGLFVLSLGLVAEASVPLPEGRGNETGKFQACPGGWSLFEGRCYRVKTNLESWANAEKDCNSVGGHLASIHSDSENAFIYRLASSTSTNIFWTGGTDAAIEVGIIYIYIHMHTIELYQGSLHASIKPLEADMIWPGFESPTFSASQAGTL
jgi:hypothetical protein